MLGGRSMTIASGTETLEAYQDKVTITVLE
jgi:hypothetical protein